MRDNEPEMSLEDLLENVKAMEAQIEDMKVPASRLHLAAALCICILKEEANLDCVKSPLVQVAAQGQLYRGRLLQCIRRGPGHDMIPELLHGPAGSAQAAARGARGPGGARA